MYVNGKKMISIIIMYNNDLSLFFMLIIALNNVTHIQASLFSVLQCQDTAGKHMGSEAVQNISRGCLLCRTRA